MEFPNSARAAAIRSMTGTRNGQRDSQPPQAMQVILMTGSTPYFSMVSLTFV